MQVVIDSNDNEGTVDHIAYSNIELAEKTTGNSFNFCRNYNIEPDKIPRFNINNFQSTGAGGTSIFDIVGFHENDESLDYWIVLMDGAEGFNLPPNPICGSTGNQPCPPPIAGYIIVAQFVGCAGGICNCNGAAATTSGFASSCSATVSNGIINQREPSSPVYNVQVKAIPQLVMNQMLIYI